MLNNWKIILILLTINQTSAVSYNQPKFCPYTAWNPNSITFANQSIVGTTAHGIFVNTNNTVYVASYSLACVKIWFEGSMSPVTINFTNLEKPTSIFVTSTDDIYVGDDTSGRIAKSRLNSPETIIVMNFIGDCNGLFVDINNAVYCCIYRNHRVIKKPLNDNIDELIVVAGNGTAGSLANQLSDPHGIFVDTNFDLYVADSGNDRVQCFKSGQLNAITVAGNGAPHTIALNCPTGVVLDADKYLFVVDHNNCRVVGSGPNGFRCLVGCTGSAGPASDQLDHPVYLSFDSYGNMFVSDRDNNRIQKFLLSTNSCVIIQGPFQYHCTLDCLPASINLITKPSNLSLIEYNLNEEIYISSNIQINCIASFQMINQWTLYNNSELIQLNPTIKTTQNEIYIPPGILTYGMYQFNLTVTLITLSNRTSFESVNIKIVQSKKIVVNLIEYGISEITLGQYQEILLEPEKYSVDGDGIQLKPNDWNYEYYCRIHNFINESFVGIHNSTCFTNRAGNQTIWEYGGSQSLLKIFPGAFQPNRTYQFMVSVTNRQDPSSKYLGFLLIRIQNSPSPRIAIGCVISTMCISNVEYQLINPTTQVALVSRCLDNCSSNFNIQWNIYQGSINSSTNITQWILFNQPVTTFGDNTNRFTISNELFLKNPSIEYWKFEVMYKFEYGIGLSAINFNKNSPPTNGNCTINPQNGTITTLFIINCSNWFDIDGIKDYSFYVWTDDYSKQLMIGFTPSSTFQTRLPIANNQNSLININVYIRDKFDCVTKSNITSVYVYEGTKEIENLFNSFKDSKQNDLTNNSFVQTLLAGNQNEVGQVITVASQQFNKVNSESLEKVVSNGIPIASVAVSTLESQPSTPNSGLLNETVLNEYHKQLNVYANMREYFINFTTDLTIVGSKSIILQATSLVQLTEATNQLTRLTSIVASKKCYDLAVILNETSHKTSYENVQTAVTLLTQCTANIMNAINGPLQERINVLETDRLRSQQISDNKNKEFLTEMNINERNFYYQKETANEISKQVNETVSLLTLALNNHLTFGQNYTIQTPQVFMILEATLPNFLANKTIEPIGNTKINFPTNFSSSLNQNQTILIRSKLEALASYGNFPSNTNLSRSLSFAILDQNGSEISIKTNENHPIELIIPRDPYLNIPEMILQNVTDSNQSFYYKFMDLKKLQPNPNLTISLHFQIQPINHTLAYLFIYQYNSSIQFNKLNGYQFFCPDLITETFYTYYIDNQQLSNQQSIIFGIRELTSIEFEEICLYNSTKNFQFKNNNADFTSNYYLRIYTSGCYYLDKNNNWQSDGLLVGPKTNLYQTQCFTNHL